MTVTDLAPLIEGELLPPGVRLKPAKRRLFEAAIQLFGDRGFDAVSVRDLVTALGMTPAVLYAHVESKQELLFDARAHRSRGAT